MEKRSKEMALMAVEAMEEKKAVDIKILDISNVSSIGDIFVIAGGNNVPQIQALADAVEERLGREGYAPRQVEGYKTAGWVLLDYHDIIVHIFDGENREFYNLERLWRDGVEMTPEELRA